MNLSISYDVAKEIGTKIQDLATQFLNQESNLKKTNSAIDSVWSGDTHNKFMGAIENEMISLDALQRAVQTIGDYIVSSTANYLKADANVNSGIN